MRKALFHHAALAWVFLCCLPFASLAQDSTAREEIEIIQAGKLRFTDKNNQKTYILTSSVILQQGDTRLFCDSAYLYTSTNTAKAFGQVHINQADSVHAYGDSATYNGNTRIAVLYENVRLTDRQMVLSTPQLTYDLNTRTGTYIHGGELRNQEVVLTSTTGYYYSAQQMAHFRNEVRLNHPDYRLEADTLQYHTGSETAWFVGPTFIYTDNSIIYCEDGYYQTVEGIAVFNQNVYLQNPPQELRTDSLYYNRETGLGKAFGNIFFSDTSQNVLQYSQQADYNEISETITSTQGSVAGYVLDDDTLFIAGDTIQVIEDSLGGNIMRAHYRVRIFKSDFQAVCDSLYYTDADSIIRLFGKPMMWSDSTQFSGDTIFMQLEQSDLKHILFSGNGFIINRDDSLLYNQIKGRLIHGYFENGEIHRLEIRGNGESIYYGKDEKNRYLGVNKAICSDIDIWIKDKKFSRIRFSTLPEATFHPMQQISPSDFLLEGFKWASELRPANRNALFTAPPVPVQDAAGDNEKPSERQSSQNEG